MSIFKTKMCVCVCVLCSYFITSNFHWHLCSNYFQQHYWIEHEQRCVWRVDISVTLQFTTFYPIYFGHHRIEYEQTYICVSMFVTLFFLNKTTLLSFSNDICRIEHGHWLTCHHICFTSKFKSNSHSNYFWRRTCIHTRNIYFVLSCDRCRWNVIVERVVNVTHFLQKYFLIVAMNFATCTSNWFVESEIDLECCKNKKNTCRNCFGRRKKRDKSHVRNMFSCLTSFDDERRNKIVFRTRRRRCFRFRCRVRRERNDLRVENSLRVTSLSKLIRVTT